MQLENKKKVNNLENYWLKYKNAMPKHKGPNSLNPALCSPLTS